MNQKGTCRWSSCQNPVYRLFWIACVVCHFRLSSIISLSSRHVCVCVCEIASFHCWKYSHMMWRVRLVRPFVNTCPFRTDFVSSLAQCGCVSNCVCVCISAMYLRYTCTEFICICRPFTNCCIEFGILSSQTHVLIVCVRHRSVHPTSFTTSFSDFNSVPIILKHFFSFSLVTMVEFFCYSCKYFQAKSIHLFTLVQRFEFSQIIERNWNRHRCRESIFISWIWLTHNSKNVLFSFSINLHIRISICIKVICIYTVTKP